MRNQPRQYQRRTTRLRLETFERRDLLSGIQPLLSPLLSASPPSVPLVTQTNEVVPAVLTAVDQAFVSPPTTTDAGLLNAPTDPTTSASLGTDVQLQPTDTTVSNPSIDPTTSSSTETVAQLQATDTTGLDPTAVSTTETNGSTPTDGSTLNGTPTDGVSTELVGTVSVNAVTDESATVSQSVVSVSDPDAGQTGTTVGTTDGSDKSGQAPVSVGSSSEGQPSSDQNAETQTTVGLNSKGAVNDGLHANDLSLPSERAEVGPISACVSPSAEDNVGLSRVEQGKVVLIGSAPVAGDSASRENSASRSTAADAPPNPSRPVNFTPSQDSSQPHADEETNMRRPSSDVAMLLIGKGHSAESPTGSYQSGSISEQAGRPDEAASGSDSKSITSISGAIARHGSSLELLSTDLFFGAEAQSKDESPEACATAITGEFEDSPPLVASARGMGLLGSPLLIDVDSLAQEAEQFFEQLEQMSQDLASLFARLNLVSGTVAIGVAATAAAVGRRQLQKGQRGLVLKSWAGKAFASYPGLGDPWIWQES